MSWMHVEQILREQAYASIDNDPMVLLEREGGPVGDTADVILARLFGFDDQIDHEWRLSRVEPELLTPIPERLTAMELAAVSHPSLRTATYKLQSSYARTRCTAEHAPDDVKPGPDFMFDVLFLRYRRTR